MGIRQVGLPLDLYALTRAGLHRFLQYAASRYGELDVRAAHRERKRGRRQGRFEVD